jgi:hypothetical protein
MVHETRVIPLDGRAHAPASLKSYMGDPRGVGTATRSWSRRRTISRSRAFGGASDKLKTTERFRPVGKDIEWSITFDDPNTWERPWTFGMRLSRDDSQQVYEYACHEGNEGMRGMLSAERAAEKAAVPRLANGSARSSSKFRVPVPCYRDSWNSEPGTGNLERQRSLAC